MKKARPLAWTCFTVPRLLRCIGQQSDLTSPLNGHRHLPLMASAVSCNSAGENFTSLCQEFLQTIRILIVGFHNLVHAKLTNLAALTASTSTRHCHSPHFNC